MSDEVTLRDEQLPLEGAGQKLARAREAAGMTIDQVAAETRIPARHLESIEHGEFSELPSRAYAIGFSRNYAQAVGLDTNEIVDEVRAELDNGVYRENGATATYEPGDPDRVPGRGLAWFSAFAAILLIVGGLAFFRGYIFPGSGPAPLVGEQQIAENQAPAAATAAPAIAVASTDRRVVFTSLEDGVWVKFYDDAGERLMEKQMAEGERYVVPADAQGPQVWTGQPEALRITIGDTDIGTLSDESEILRDIDVTAEALLARNSAEPAPADDSEPQLN
ncbi:DUF4115 domain-containing protein [Altererythrobacter luteolus]|uniref:DUF4115 domain-containing protein n=1 Tax=Pontixanthobacter luteolus TaxID=295089 RepID=A0A6I4V0J3_9SPHN|nr:RodZ domain-containing protein [Pontixanthobacter luteolus]MXP47368.1 DUF4115 domain-containing protein [Pontixanthobacter luteolus]